VEWQNYFCINCDEYSIILCMMKSVKLTIFALFTTALPTDAILMAQRQPPVSPVQPPAYADIADLVLRSPIIVDSVIRGVERLKGEESTGVSARFGRLLVQADVSGLIRGDNNLPPRITYIVDLVLDSRGKLANLKKQRMMLFGRPVSGSPNKIQLSGPDSQRLWSPMLDALTRQITAEALAKDAPPPVTGIGNAFYVAGALPGEGETQVFLTTADGRPISLSILRRPGETPRWAVALSEIVDEAAAPPTKDSLLWYRLACGLPANLPDSAIRSLDTADGEAARNDYRFVIRSLGRCNRGEGGQL